MVFRRPHILAILTACTTVLAGMPPLAATLPADAGTGTCVAPAPRDPDAAADTRQENAGKELEEKEKQQEDVDGRIHLFAGTSAAIQLKAGLCGSADPDACPAVRSFSAPALSIRGPPPRG